MSCNELGVSIAHRSLARATRRRSSPPFGPSTSSRVSFCVCCRGLPRRGSRPLRTRPRPQVCCACWHWPSPLPASRQCPSRWCNGPSGRTCGCWRTSPTCVTSMSIAVTLALTGLRRLRARLVTAARECHSRIVLLAKGSMAGRPLPTGLRPHTLVRGARLRAPTRGASLLVFAVLNVDYIDPGRLEGPQTLALYVLAFNVAFWPVSAVSGGAPQRRDAGFRPDPAGPDHSPTLSSCGRRASLLTLVLPGGCSP